MSDERPTGVPAGQLALHVELDGDDLDRKLTALRAMSTQTADVIALVGPETYAVQVAEEGFVAADADRSDAACSGLNVRASLSAV